MCRECEALRRAYESAIVARLQAEADYLAALYSEPCRNRHSGENGQSFIGSMDMHTNGSSPA